jgi:hypothetical protein
MFLKLGLGLSRLCWLRGQEQRFNRLTVDCDLPLLLATSLIQRPISKREIALTCIGISHLARSIVFIAVEGIFVDGSGLSFTVAMGK